MSESIPLIVIDEHHEAFFVWRHAVAKKWMPASMNTLVHIDEHHDLSVPVIQQPLASLATEADVLDFTYGQLMIGNFIWPAVLDGTFAEMFWLKHFRRLSQRKVPLWIHPRNAKELEFVVSARGPAVNARKLELNLLRPKETMLPARQYVLDIDFDYFACNTSRPPCEVEITEEAYKACLSNPYSLLGIPATCMVRVERRRNSCFLVFREPPVETAPITESSIDERIRSVFEYLSRTPGRPHLIVCCRSVFSGYTPAECVEYIERRVLAELSALFNCKTIAFSRLLPTSPGCHEPEIIPRTLSAAPGL
jgi:hypothetical protein